MRRRQSISACLAATALALTAAACEHEPRPTGPSVSALGSFPKWVAQTCPACTSYLEEVQFVDRNHGWLVGGNATVATTTAGGSTWVRRNVPRNTAILHGVHFFDSSRGWAVGQARLSPGLILTSRDGGGTWQQQYVAPGINSAFYSVAFGTPNAGIAIGSVGIRYTRDGGATWQRATNEPGTGRYSITMPDAIHAWFADDNGRIYATDDGGATWTEQITAISGTSLRFRGIEFVDADYGWAVGSEGTIVRTFNGGDSWFTMRSGTSTDLWSVSFSDRRHGVATGAHGTALVTRDGGFSWTPESTGTGWLLETVSSVDPSQAWAVGPVGTIRARTTVPLWAVPIGDVLLRPDRWRVVVSSLWLDVVRPVAAWTCWLLNC